MKDRLKKSFLFLLAIFVLLAAVLTLYSVTVYRREYPDYTSYNADRTGIKALYLLTEKCGFNVSRFHYPVKFFGENSVMVVYRPAESLFNEEEEQEGLKNWMCSGNTLVLIIESKSAGNLWIFDFISETRQWYEVETTGNITVTWYGLENGMVCILDSANSFLNENISGNDAAVAFIKALLRIDNPKVVFNEYYQFMQKPAPGLWDLIGPTGQLIAIQLAIVIILVCVRGWKTFGRARDSGKMDKRPENETVMALSGLYQRMKAYPLVLSNYYSCFIRKHARFLSLPGPIREKAISVTAECEHCLRTGKLSKKKLKALVFELEKLENEINSIDKAIGKG